MLTNLIKPKLLICTGVFACIAYLLSAQQIARTYQDYFNHQLTPKLNQAWHDAADMGQSPQTSQLIELQTVKQLNQIEWQNPLQIFDYCLASPNSNTRRLSWLPTSTLDLQIPLHSPQLLNQSFRVDCRLKPLPWLSLTALFFVFVTLLKRTSSFAFSHQDQTLVQHLQSLAKQQVLAKRQLKLWLKQLKAFRLQHPAAKLNLLYLQRYLARRPNDQRLELTKVDFTQLLERASQPLTLQFLCYDGNLQARVSDIEIPLSITPTLYWYWYAQFRKQQEHGWVVNPPTNRPSHEMAKSLLNLMAQFGGHGRAKKELEDNGMRAKTLDQNRNKIKEALIKALGEPLADECSFESHKLEGQPQAKYRLKMSPKQILSLKETN